AVVIAFEIDAVTHLRREVAARTDLWEHGADDEAGDLFPGVRRHAVGRGGRNQLPAKRDRPALIEVVHDPRLTEHVAKAGDGRAGCIFGRHPVCPYDWNFGSEVQLPLRGKPERRVDPGERRVRFDPFGRSLLDAWTRGFGIAVEKLDLAQRPCWVVAGRVRDIERIRAGKNRTRHAQSASDRSATCEGEKRASRNLQTRRRTNAAHLIATRFLQKVSRL